jgi:hypothetical protein
MRNREIEDQRRNKEEIYTLGSSSCSPILGNGISEGETDKG